MYRPDIANCKGYGKSCTSIRKRKTSVSELEPTTTTDFLKKEKEKRGGKGRRGRKEKGEEEKGRGGEKITKCNYCQGSMSPL